VVIFPGADARRGRGAAARGAGTRGVGRGPRTRASAVAVVR